MDTKTEKTRFLRLSPPLDLEHSQSCQHQVPRDRYMGVISKD